MNYLIDTHVLIWALLEPAKLNKKIERVLTEPKNNIFVSSVSLWEISLKFSLRKLSLIDFMPNQLPAMIQETGFILIDMEAKDAATFYRLEKIDDHLDPFDRMLIWQSICRNMTLISVDRHFGDYSRFGAKVL